MTLQIPAEVTTDFCSTHFVLLREIYWLKLECGSFQFPFILLDSFRQRKRSSCVSTENQNRFQVNDPSVSSWHDDRRYSISLVLWSMFFLSFRQFIAVKLRRKTEDSSFWNISCTIQNLDLFSGVLTRGLLWSCCNISFFYHGTASPGGDGAKSQDTGHSRGPEISVNQKVQRLQF